MFRMAKKIHYWSLSIILRNSICKLKNKLLFTEIGSNILNIPIGIPKVVWNFLACLEKKLITVLEKMCVQILSCSNFVVIESGIVNIGWIALHLGGSYLPELAIGCKFTDWWVNLVDKKCFACNWTGAILVNFEW